MEALTLVFNWLMGSTNIHLTNGIFVLAGMFIITLPFWMVFFFRWGRQFPMIDEEIELDDVIELKDEVPEEINIEENEKNLKKVLDALLDLQKEISALRIKREEEEEEEEIKIKSKDRVIMIFHTIDEIGKSVEALKDQIPPDQNKERSMHNLVKNWQKEKDRIKKLL